MEVNSEPCCLSAKDLKKKKLFNNEANDHNPLTAHYYSLMVHLRIFTGFLIHLNWFYFQSIFSTNCYGPVDVCFLEFGDGGIGEGCDICLELMMKTPQQCQRCSSDVFVVCFGNVLRYHLLFPFSTLGM